MGVCTWNYSGTLITNTWLGQMLIEMWPEVCGLVSLSFAYQQWEMTARFAGKEAGAGLKQEMENHSQLKIPALYVFGNKDVHTPYDQVERIIKARPDGGKNAEIYLVNQDGQDLIG